MYVIKNAISNVLSCPHLRFFPERRTAMNDPKGKDHLVKCVAAMCNNLCSFYLTFMPGKKYSEFQNALFMHIRKYTVGISGITPPALSSRTRSGRKSKDAGSESFIRPDDCKKLWETFVKSLTINISLNDQCMIVSSIAYAVYDLMIDEMKELKHSMLGLDMESSEKAVSSPSVEDEHTIHRYLGFAIQSLVTQKKNKLVVAVAGHPTFKLWQQLKVLQLLIPDSTDQLPNSIVGLSQGRLTHVSSQMIKYGGDLLLEFSKPSGNRFNHDTAEISKSVIDNEELYKCFKDCVLLTINSTDSLLMDVDSNTIETIYSELSVKIINS